MGRWSTVELNGVTFELDNKEKVNNPCVFYKSIYDVYGRCSEAKKNIWESWAGWFREANSHMFGVTSHNSNFFTICGVVQGLDGEYFVRITKAHNRAWKVNRMSMNSTYVGLE